jgi:hypothetical protein
VRLPIKLNADCVPSALRQLLHASDDPRAMLRTDADGRAFARAVSVLKFGRTFKSTAPSRFPHTLLELRRLSFAAPPVVLDVGASDGSTSLDVMQAIEFRRYYCTDLNVETEVTERGAWTYFHAHGGTPILAASDRWIAYNDVAGAPLPLSALCRRIFAQAPSPEQGSRRVPLMNPTLRARLGHEVIFQCYNALEPWRGEPADLVLTANLLNRSYFRDAELIQILGHLRGALAARGWLVLIENRKHERASLLRIEGGAVRVHARVGSGAELEPLALQVLTGQSHE